jgi:hypothetical protein
MTKIERSECVDTAETPPDRPFRDIIRSKFKLPTPEKKEVVTKEEGKLNVQELTKQCLWDYPRHAQPC